MICHCDYKTMLRPVNFSMGFIILIWWYLHLESAPLAYHESTFNMIYAENDSTKGKTKVQLRTQKCTLIRLRSILKLYWKSGCSWCSGNDILLAKFSDYIYIVILTLTEWSILPGGNKSLIYVICAEGCHFCDSCSLNLRLFCEFNLYPTLFEHAIISL